MQMLKCTEEEAYFVASEAAHAMEPTAATAAGCAYMYYKKGDLDKSVQYLTRLSNWNRKQKRKQTMHIVQQWYCSAKNS